MDPATYRNQNVELKTKKLLQLGYRLAYVIGEHLPALRADIWRNSLGANEVEDGEQTAVVREYEKFVGMDMGLTEIFNRVARVDGHSAMRAETVQALAQAQFRNVLGSNRLNGPFVLPRDLEYFASQAISRTELLRTLVSDLVGQETALNMATLNATGGSGATILGRLRQRANAVGIQHDEKTAEAVKDLKFKPQTEQLKYLNGELASKHLSMVATEATLAEVLFTVGLLMTRVVDETNAREAYSHYIAAYGKNSDFGSSAYKDAMASQSKVLKRLSLYLDVLRQPPTSANAAISLKLLEYDNEAPPKRMTAAAMLIDAASTFVRNANKIYVFVFSGKGQSKILTPTDCFYAERDRRYDGAWFAANSTSTLPTAEEGARALFLSKVTVDPGSPADKVESVECHTTCNMALKHASQLNFEDDDVERICKRMCEPGTGGGDGCLHDMYTTTQQSLVQTPNLATAQRRARSLALSVVNFADEAHGECNKSKTFQVDVCKQRVRRAQPKGNGYNLFSNSPEEFEEAVCDPNGDEWSKFATCGGVTEENISSSRPTQDAKCLRDLAMEMRDKDKDCNVALKKACKDKGEDEVTCFLAAVEGSPDFLDHRFDQVRYACQQEARSITKQLVGDEADTVRRLLDQRDRCAVLDIFLRRAKNSGEPYEAILRRLVQESCDKRKTFTHEGTVKEVASNISNMRAAAKEMEDWYKRLGREGGRVPTSIEFTRTQYTKVVGSVMQLSYEQFVSLRMSPFDVLFHALEMTAVDMVGVTRATLDEYEGRPLTDFVKELDAQTNLYKDGLALGYIKLSTAYLLQKIDPEEGSVDQRVDAMTKDLRRAFDFHSFPTNDTRSHIVQSANLSSTITKTVHGQLLEFVRAHVSATEHRSSSTVDNLHTILEIAIKSAISIFDAFGLTAPRRGEVVGRIHLQGVTSNTVLTQVKQAVAARVDDDKNYLRDVLNQIQRYKRLHRGDVARTGTWDFWVHLTFGSFVSLDFFLLEGVLWQSAVDAFLGGSPDLALLHLAITLLKLSKQPTRKLRGHLEDVIEPYVRLMDTASRSDRVLLETAGRIQSAQFSTKMAETMQIQVTKGVADEAFEVKGKEERKEFLKRKKPDGQKLKETQRTSLFQLLNYPPTANFVDSSDVQEKNEIEFLAKRMIGPSDGDLLSRSSHVRYGTLLGWTVKTLAIATGKFVVPNILSNFARENGSRFVQRVVQATSTGAEQASALTAASAAWTILGSALTGVTNQLIQWGVVSSLGTPDLAYINLISSIIYSAAMIGILVQWGHTVVGEGKDAEEASKSVTEKNELVQDYAAYLAARHNIEQLPEAEKTTKLELIKEQKNELEQRMQKYNIENSDSFALRQNPLVLHVVSGVTVNAQRTLTMLQKVANSGVTIPNQTVVRREGETLMQKGTVQKSPIERRLESAKKNIGQSVSSRTSRITKFFESWANAIRDFVSEEVTEDSVVIEGFATVEESAKVVIAALTKWSTSNPSNTRGVINRTFRSPLDPTDGGVNVSDVQHLFVLVSALHPQLQIKNSEAAVWHTLPRPVVVQGPCTHDISTVGVVDWITHNYTPEAHDLDCLGDENKTRAGIKELTDALQEIGYPAYALGSYSGASGDTPLAPGRNACDLLRDISTSGKNAKGYINDILGPIPQHTDDFKEAVPIYACAMRCALTALRAAERLLGVTYKSTTQTQPKEEEKRAFTSFVAALLLNTLELSKEREIEQFVLRSDDIDTSLELGILDDPFNVFPKDVWGDELREYDGARAYHVLRLWQMQAQSSQSRVLPSVSCGDDNEMVKKFILQEPT